MDPPDPDPQHCAAFQIQWIRKYLASWIWIRTPMLNSELQIRGPGCNIQILTFNQRFKEVIEQKFNILQNSDDVPILQDIF